MRLRLFAFLLLLGSFTPIPCLGRAPKACVTIDDAAKLTDKDVCITAHVYDLVQMPDGTRFLDVCSPEIPDAECRFTVVSYWDDRGEVGDLSHFLHSDVRMRGIVQAMHGRSGMLLSHARQFRGGPPKFRPNPRLLHGFSAATVGPALRDPNLRPHGGARSFMNTKNRTTEK